MGGEYFSTSTLGFWMRIDQAVDGQFNSTWRLNHDITNKGDDIVCISRQVLPRAKAGECNMTLSDFNFLLLLNIYQPGA